MSHTSTSLVAAPRERRFRRAFAVLVAVLVVLTSSFVGISVLQGPKLSSAQLDTTAVISTAGQQLRLFLNQAVRAVAPAQVSVEPAARVSVSVQGNLVAVQFDDPLRYGTDYRVTIEEVTGASGTTSSTVSYSFSTPVPRILYLDRADAAGADDEIVATTLDSTQRDVVYSAPRIQDFVRCNGVLAVVSLTESNTSELRLVNLADGAVEVVRLPEAGVIQKLGAASTGEFLGFTFTSADGGITPANSSTLYAITLDSTHQPNPVVGVNGDPVRVLDWQFFPQGNRLLALTHAQDLLEVDLAAGGAVVPRGQFTGLGPVSRDGTVVTVTDAFGTAALTLTDGTQVRLQPPLVPGVAERVYLGPTEVLADGSRLEKLVIAQPGGRSFASALAIDIDGTARVIFRTIDDRGAIDGFSVSPNGQYVAIETVPDVGASESDGYRYNARSTSIETVFVDLDTGAVVRSVAGFAPRW